MARMHVAVRPPAEVVDAVLAARPEGRDDVEWTDPARWIVKLRPLGHVPEALVDPLAEAMEAELDGAAPVPVRLLATLRRYGNQQLVAPVEGLDDVVAAVLDATEPLVPVTHPQPLYADLVLAHGRVPRELAGLGIDVAWTVADVRLVADRSSPRRIRIEDLATVPLLG